MLLIPKPATSWMPSYTLCLPGWFFSQQSTDSDLSSGAASRALQDPPAAQHSWMKGSLPSPNTTQSPKSPAELYSFRCNRVPEYEELVITPIVCQAGTLGAGLPPPAQAGTIILLSLCQGSSQALQHHPAASDNKLQHGGRTQK